MRIDVVPMWVLFAATIAVVMVAIEAGYQLGKAMHRRSKDEKESPVSAMAGAVLALAAFMLAFAFGIVAERNDAKKALVRDDAIAIGTAWRRSDFLPDTDRAEAAALLREYVDLHLTFVEAASLAPERVRVLRTETKRIQDRLWDMAVANARKDMNSDVAALYIDSLNAMNAVHTLRVAIGIQTRVPVAIWLVLYCSTLLGMTGVGYQTGIAGSRRSMAEPILALSFALVIALIVSLDRPESGVMKVTQQPLIDLHDSMVAAAGGERE